jgi:hypothetical protein
MNFNPRMPWVARTLLVWVAFLVMMPDQGFADDGATVFQIKPSATDPQITHFDAPNYVLFDDTSSPQQELVVFLPGTNGRPRNGERLFHVIVAQGYRVIGLEYNDEPAVVQVCPRNPSPSCSEAVRQRRIFGIDSTNIVENTRAESIVGRLVSLLKYLDEHDPERQWGSYLAGNEPNWRRIVVSGLSQGAGMAAYIAKQREVARVVLFSSPWDFYGSSKELAPWLREPSATPPQRWFAEYHQRENTAALIARAYRQLRIPTENIRIFNLDVPPDIKVNSENPFHGSTIKVPEYADQWAFLFGHSP